MTGQRLVLRHKASGKIASRRDQQIKALILEAKRLTYDGIGGGIAALLLPISEQDKIEIAKIEKTYTVCRVKTRPGSKGTVSDRKALRSAVSDDLLIAKLAVLYGENIGNKPGPHKTSAKAFTRWVKTELKNSNSAASKVIRNKNEAMFYVERCYRWWADAIAQRRKTQS